MITGKQFLEVERTLRNLDGEAFDRTRIGRLYYAVFLECRSLCETRLGYSRVKMSREHQAVVNMLGSLDPALADALRVLRQAHNEADYDVNLPSYVIAERTEDAVLLADFLMAHLTRFQ